MEKIKCPKCRKILMEYESNVKDGIINLNIKCSACKALTVLHLGTDVTENEKKRIITK